MIVLSKYHTKNWRNSQSWYKGGKHIECEIYQRNLIEQITKLSCIKTTLRINWRTIEFRENRNPLKNPDGFDWTEDFDGKQIINGKHLYYNFKFVCDAGGAQTRTLRETYHFIESQLRYLNKNHDDETTYFINILDGDESYKNRQHFDFLQSLKEYEKINHRIFIGDTYIFQHWFKANFAPEANVQ